MPSVTEATPLDTGRTPSPRTGGFYWLRRGPEHRREICVAQYCESEARWTFCGDARRHTDAEIAAAGWMQWDEAADPDKIEDRIGWAALGEDL